MRMQFAVLSIAAALVILLIGSAAPGDEPSVQLDLDSQSKCNWIVLDYRSDLHVAHVDVNGKRLADLAGPGGIVAKASPLKEGKNTINAEFLRKEERAFMPSPSKLRIFLSPTPELDQGTETPLDTTLGVGAIEWTIEIRVTDGFPHLLSYVTREWPSVERKNLEYEERGTADEKGLNWATLRKKWWSEEGVLLSETVEEKSRLVTGKFYKYDGALGAQIDNGKGIYKEWFTENELYLEVPYVDGMRHGILKTYHGAGVVDSTAAYDKGVREGPAVIYWGNGKPLIKGTFRKGQMHGTWIRYDHQGKETARSKFKDGTLVEGEDDFWELAEEE